MWGRLAAGWQPARDPEGAPSTAAVRCNSGSWPIDNRPQLTKLPHRSAASLAYHLRSDASLLPMNRVNVHFNVAHPPPTLISAGISPRTELPRSEERRVGKECRSR